MRVQSIEEVAYPEIRFGAFSRVDGTVAFFTRVKSLLQNASTVVDIGCGRGARQDDVSGFRRKLTDLRASDRRVIGLDVSPTAATNPCIDEFRLIAPAAPWPINDRSVDLILSDYVLEHVNDPRIFFAEVARVLRPAGYFCARTPNKWGYVALASAALPQNRHGKLVAKLQTDRKEVDVFPTVYRANTPRTLYSLTRGAGLEAVVLAIEGEPNYLKFSPFLYRVASWIHVALPPLLRSTLLVFAQKSA